MTQPGSPATPAHSFAPLSAEFLKLVHGEGVQIYAIVGDGQILHRWFCSTGSAGVTLPLNPATVPGYVAATQQSVRLNDLSDVAGVAASCPGLQYDPALDPSPFGPERAVLALPVIFQSRPVGVIEVAAAAAAPGGGFSEASLRVAQQVAQSLAPTLAAQAGQTDRVAPVAKTAGAAQEPPPQDAGAPPGRSGPYDELISRNEVSAQTLRDFEYMASHARVSVGRLLIEKAGVPEKEVRACLSRFYGVPAVKFDPAERPDPILLDQLNRQYLERQRWVPLCRTGTHAIVLIDDPTDTSRLDEAREILEVLECEVRVGLLEDILAFLGEEGLAYVDLGPSSEREAELGNLAKELLAEHEADADTGTAAAELIDGEAPRVVRVVGELIANAIRLRASDLHIEPAGEQETGRARIRVDGVCHDVLAIPRGYMRAVVSRVKVMANLDIAERRIAQDGKMTVRLGQKTYELRVAVVPTVNGESIVLRILAPGSVLRLDQLNFSAPNLARIRSMLEVPHGILLVVGPTGSGKTTTLHGLLECLNTPERKIWTAEDPVEITQRGLQQLQVEPKKGVTFATALRAFLRADPDVILIGEMRDRETAHAGIEASLTGHLVLSTLHTNSAAETVTRLLDIGLDPANFADALIGVLAQRLVRVLCPDCKTPYHPDAEEIDRLVSGYGAGLFADLGVAAEALTLYRPVGCDRCMNTGYRGRTGIHELLVATPGLKRQIVRSKPADEIRDAAVAEGMRTLRQDGIMKVLLGQTDAAEVWAATVSA